MCKHMSYLVFDRVKILPRQELKPELQVWLWHEQEFLFNPLFFIWAFGRKYKDCAHKRIDHLAYDS